MHKYGFNFVSLCVKCLYPLQIYIRIDCILKIWLTSRIGSGQGETEKRLNMDLDNNPVNTNVQQQLDS